jgi:glycosyltransferase involved in cell wall biosynthesis
VIVGDGPLRAELERSLQERRLKGSAVFTGALPHDEIAGLIRQFDLALAPYPELNHAFYFSPLKIFEYMACGVPVVAARVGQIVEVVKDGVTGLLYPPGDLETLTAACERLLGDSGLRRRLGQAAAEVIVGQYTWDHHAAHLTELARSIITDRGTV